MLDQTDPAGDDSGPGNFAYPTAADFHAGAYDIQEFLVIGDGTNITFKLRVRDLSPTFGSSLGAQLVDVYVHTPGAAPADTSTAASFPQRDYQIAVAGGWKGLLEVQGFGQRYIDRTARRSARSTTPVTSSHTTSPSAFRRPASGIQAPAGVSASC